MSRLVREHVMPSRFRGKYPILESFVDPQKHKNTQDKAQTGFLHSYR